MIASDYTYPEAFEAALVAIWNADGTRPQRVRVQLTSSLGPPVEQAAFYAPHQSALRKGHLRTPRGQ